jgi:hypothetical protein
VKRKRHRNTGKDKKGRKTNTKKIFKRQRNKNI